MSEKSVRPVDLSERRKAKGHTQADLADILGLNMYTISSYEVGRRNMSTASACEIARLYGGLALEYEGQRFELRVVDDGGAEKKVSPLAGSWTDNAFNSAQQARELQEWSEQLSQHLVSIRNGRGSEEYLVRGYKEASEAEAAIKDLVEEGLREHPHLVQLGKEMAETVAAVRQDGGDQYAAMDEFLKENAHRLRPETAKEGA